MKRTVKFEGLECANCAKNLEENLCKLDFVKELKIDFAKGTLTFESEKEDALEKLVAKAKKIEPDFAVENQIKSRRVRIKGLDCANCARNLEEKICKLPSVKNAQINFSKKTLFFESEDLDLAFDEIVKLTTLIEPQASIQGACKKEMNACWDARSSVAKKK